MARRSGGLARLLASLLLLLPLLLSSSLPPPSPRTRQRRPRSEGRWRRPRQNAFDTEAEVAVAQQPPAQHLLPRPLIIELPSSTAPVLIIVAASLDVELVSAGATQRPPRATSSSPLSRSPPLPRAPAAASSSLISGGTPRGGAPRRELVDLPRRPGGGREEARRCGHERRCGAPPVLPHPVLAENGVRGLQTRRQQGGDNSRWMDMEPLLGALAIILEDNRLDAHGDVVAWRPCHIPQSHSKRATFWDLLHAARGQPRLGVLATAVAGRCS